MLCTSVHLSIGVLDHFIWSSTSTGLDSHLSISEESQSLACTVNKLKSHSLKVGKFRTKVPVYGQDF